jgi:cell division septation protein DedD
MVIIAPQAASLWESAGQRAAPSLTGVSIAAVLGVDPASTAAVALGLARAQSQRRRVVLCDLFEEGSAITKLVGDSDLTGVSDVIEHGVSLGYAARHADRVGNLLVVPPGYDTPLSPEVLEHPRWRRLAAEFHDADALLLLALPANAASIRPLLDVVDGVVTVDTPSATASHSKVLAEVTRAVRRTPATPAAGTPHVHRAPVVVEPPPKRPHERTKHNEHPIAWTSTAIGLVAAAVLMVVGYYAFANRGSQTSSRDAAVDTVSAAGSAYVDERAVVNPLDSIRAAAFSIEASAANTTFGAFEAMRTWSSAIPVATFIPVQQNEGAAVWYRVRLGAFARASDAAAFVDSMRPRFEETTGIGAVIRAPFAFVIDSTRSGLARELVETYRQRGVPAYGLADSNDLVRIYVGAFESPLDAERMRGTLIAANINAALAYRVGGPY